MLEAGMKAPSFEGKDQNGNIIKLEDYKGKKLVLFFYPEDDTPGCTKEACNLRDHFEELKNKGYELLGVSKDDEQSHQKFISKYQLPFPLIADTDKAILTAYDGWGEKNMYGKKILGALRKTYLIDQEGVIKHIFKKVDTAKHSEQILAKDF